MARGIDLTATKMSEEQDEVAREAAYLENITKRKQQAFKSKVFGGLEAAREGKAPTATSPSHKFGGGPALATPTSPTHNQAPLSPRSPVTKTWNQPKAEPVHQEPVKSTTPSYSYLQHQQQQPVHQAYEPRISFISPSFSCSLS